MQRDLFEVAPRSALACKTGGGDPESFTEIMELFEQRQNLERFGELVLADHELHDRLRAAANAEAFVALAVQLGAERGCMFTSKAVEAALQEQQRAWQERWI